MSGGYCPHCATLFLNAEALKAHRASCKAYAGEKPKPKPEPAPDLYDGWSIGEM